MAVSENRKGKRYLRVLRMQGLQFPPVGFRLLERLDVMLMGLSSYNFAADRYALMYQAAFSKSSYIFGCFKKFLQYIHYRYIVGSEAGNERKAGFYCCNYCDKDLSGLVRFKCAVCMDFDLCVECFSVGVELNRHKNSHPYRVMVSFQRRVVYLNSIERSVS